MTSMTSAIPDRTEVAVIGGGAAGLMAAATAAEYGAKVTVLERNDRLGRKLRITGKGRCNLTNNCGGIDEFLANVPTNPRFLYASLAAWSPADTMRFFEDLGVPLKTERGNRVFPQSDRADDIADALVRRCRSLGVRFLHGKVTDLGQEETGGFRIGSDAGTVLAGAVILCTGGRSYPATGSDGSGFELARRMGHTVTPLSPSLVPLVDPTGSCAAMQGLSLRNVRLTVRLCATGEKVFEEFGELLFTHFGISGPIVLSASAYLKDVAPMKYTAEIDLKPALDEKTLDARLVSDFVKYANRDFANALDDLLPQKMILPMIRKSGIDPRKKVHSVTKEERTRLAALLKAFPVPISGTRSFPEAIITRGGIPVREVHPGTMESKRTPGLWFAGEMLDVDALTGGFNLQIAFSTARLAGMHAAQSVATLQ